MPYPDLTTEDGVVALMESSQTEQQWNANCDAVKAANKGYPAFWFASIIQSGLFRRVAPRWGSDGKMKLSSVGVDGSINTIALED